MTDAETTTPRLEVPNLDAMDRTDLEALARDYERRLHSGAMPRDDALVVGVVLAYARTKSAASRLRLAGRIEDASYLEEACHKIYWAIPAHHRW